MMEQNQFSNVLVNINSSVEVELADLGKKLLKQKKFPMSHVNEENKITTELWDLMSIFGEHFRVGQNAIFVNNNIKILS